MKKTTIIILCVVYLLSIVAVQFFGVPVTVPEAGEYINSISIEAVELTNRIAGQSEEVVVGTNKDGNSTFKFRFIASEGDPYTTDAESLASNPNRLKVTFAVDPVGASVTAIKILVADETNVVLTNQDGLTFELVFLKKTATKIIIKEDKASLSVQEEFVIGGLL